MKGARFGSSARCAARAGSGERRGTAIAGRGCWRGQAAAGSETTTSTAVTGAYAPTCSLPTAELRWSKDDATPTGAVNEAESIQPKDTGQFFRQAESKYICNADGRQRRGMRSA